MKQKIFKFLLVSLFLTVGLMLPGGKAHAITFSYNMTLDGITSADFTTSATYTYNFSQNAGSSTLSYVDFEIPAEVSIPAGSFSGATSTFSVTANGVALSGEVYDIGVGDYGTKFGVGDSRYRVLKANIPNPTQNFKVVLTLKGQTFASGRRFADASQSDFGVVLIKAGNGANTQTFVIQTPTVVNSPVAPPPMFTSAYVYPNPVVVPGECATASWTVSDSSALVTITPTDNVTITGNSATICPVQAGVYTYQITATGSTGSSTETFFLTAVDPAAPPPGLSLSILPNPVTPPGCATIKVELSDPNATVTIAPQSFVVTDPNDPFSLQICFDVNVAPGTYTYQITATGTTGSSTASFSLTVNPAPVYETTCKQIKKNSLNGTSTCVNLCLRMVNGAQQDIASATWYNNGDCAGDGVPLTIYTKDSPEKTLVCNPCQVDVPPGHPQACTTNEDPNQTPFRYYLAGAPGNPWKHCDVFKYAVQDEDIGVILGDDPWRYTKSGTMYWSAY